MSHVTGAEHWANVERLERLGASDEESAIPALMEALSDEDGCFHTRTAAIQSLVTLNASSAGTAILKLLARDKDLGVREAAIIALGALRYGPSKKLLSKIAGDPGDALAAIARSALEWLSRV